MRKHRRTKAQNQTCHFKKRCEERLGVQIDRKTIQRRIKEKNFDEDFYLLNKQSNRVTRYRYKFENKWYIIPYDRNTHKVITIFEDRMQDIILSSETEPIVKSTKFSFVCFVKLIIEFVRKLQLNIRFFRSRS